MADFKLFVYGSLKTGECNEAELRPWLGKVVPATTRGTMALRPDGYPALSLGQYGVLGTTDYLQDTQLGQAPVPDSGHLIRGQLMWLNSPLEAIPRLDEFEGFYPGGPSEYLRVSLSVETENGVEPCWTYIGAYPPPEQWPRIESWPPPWFEGPPEPYQAFST